MPTLMQFFYRNFLWALVLALAGLPAATAGAAEEITDSQFGFSFRMPEPFVRQEANPKQPDTVYSYVDRNPGPEEPANIIQIQRIRGIIDPNSHLTAADVAGIPGGKASLESLSWRGLELDVVRTVFEHQQGRPTVGYTVQMPLQREAVQIVIAGPEDRDDEIRHIFNTTVADFKNLKPLYGSATAAKSTGALASGPMTTEQRASKMFRGIALLLISAAILFAIVRTIFRLFRKAK